jgi:hypothetical protein
MIQKFIANARKRLTEGDAALRKAVLLALVDHVIVDGKTIYLIVENDKISSAMADNPGRKPSKRFAFLFRNGAPSRDRTSTPLGNSILSRARLPVPP